MNQSVFCVFEQSPVQYPEFQDFRQNCRNRKEKNSLPTNLLGVPQHFSFSLLWDSTSKLLSKLDSNQIGIVTMTGVIEFGDPAYCLCLELRLSWGQNHVSALVAGTTMELSHSRSGINDTLVKLSPIQSQFCSFSMFVKGGGRRLIEWILNNTRISAWI